MRILLSSGDGYKLMSANSTDQLSVNRTKEVLRDKDLMMQIRKGKSRDAKSSDFEEVAKELGI